MQVSGITLLPQAGVALGMCITARQLGPEGDLIRNITLFAVLIYELIGPVLTKQVRPVFLPMLLTRVRLSPVKVNFGKRSSAGGQASEQMRP